MKKLLFALLLLLPLYSLAQTQQLCGIASYYTSGTAIQMDGNTPGVLYNPPSKVLSTVTITLPVFPCDGQVVEVALGGTLNGSPVCNAVNVVPYSGTSFILSPFPISNPEGGTTWLIRFTQAVNAWFVVGVGTPPTGGGGSGTVTSVSVVTNQGVSGSVATATTTPAITLSLGALTGVTSYNGLVVTPNTGAITTGSWAGTTIPILHGGTGQTTANAALNALLPSQTSQAGNFLTTDGTNTSWAAISAALTATQIGYGSGSNLLTGDGNFVYVTGQGIGIQDNSTNKNIFIGTPTNLSGNSTNQGSANIGIGYNALTQLTGLPTISGMENVAIGTNALNANTTGSNNVGIGDVFQSAQITGNDLVGIGSGDVSADGWNNSIGLGQGWSITASNQFVVGGNGVTAITQWVINNIVYNMPSAQGGAGTVLANDGSGNLSWLSGGGASNLQTTPYITGQTTTYTYAPYTNTDINPHTYRVGITTTFYSGASGYVNETVTYTDENSNTQTVYFASYDNNITAGAATLTTFIGNSGAGVYTCPVKDIIVGAGQSIQITITAVTLASSTYDANASIFLIN